MTACLARRLSSWSLALASAAVLLAGSPPPLYAQLALPQLDKRIAFDEPATRNLTAAFSAIEAGAALTPATNTLLISILPAEFRDACHQMTKFWDPGESSWTAKLLNLAREPNNLTALLAYRCAANGLPKYFDERPAVLRIEGPTGSLTFIPLAEPCDNCSDLYSVNFVATLPVDHGSLLKLEVASSSDNPCCGGSDSFSHDTLFWIAMPQAQVALHVDSRTEFDGYDDESEESSQEVCTAEIKEVRDTAGNVAEISAATTCVADKVPQKPPESLRYLWDSATARFQPTAKPKNSKKQPRH